MCDPVTATVAVAGLSAGVSYYQGQKQEKAMEKAAKQAEKQAADTAARAEQDINRKNAKKPNYAALAAGNALAAQSGQGSTMLTGPAGVNSSDLLLGKNTLLGG